MQGFGLNDAYFDVILQDKYKPDQDRHLHTNNQVDYKFVV